MKGKTMTNNEHINQDGNCYCGSLECLGNMRVMADKFALENARLTEELNTAKTAHRIATDRIVNATQFIQNSIDRDEWTEDELAEPFWEELTNYLEIDLKQTEEIEITVTVTYSGTVTVPKGTDVGYLELGNSWSLGVDLDGESVGEVSLDDTEIERSY